VNHSTVLVQQPGLNILTDPIWSDRASPVSWLGPCGWMICPTIDAVFTSHNHYDHYGKTKTVDVNPLLSARPLVSAIYSPYYQLTTKFRSFACARFFAAWLRPLFRKNWVV
jgi:L-ascorbate metabolism protein UlaG (beta-lactamase superfamily)